MAPDWYVPLSLQKLNGTLSPRGEKLPPSVPLTTRLFSAFTQHSQINIIHALANYGESGLFVGTSHIQFRKAKSV
jgi:hypothetical protein